MSYDLGADLRGAVEHKKALRKTQIISLDIKTEHWMDSFHYSSVVRFAEFKLCDV